VDVRRFSGRAHWPERLRNGLTAFHAAQNARDEIVEFTLTAAAREVLVAAAATPLLDVLDDREGARLRRELDALLAGFELTADQRDRLRGRMLDTLVTGSTQATREYLGRYGASLEPGDLKWWNRQRGKYLHSGRFDDDPPRRYRLRHAVGVCITAELDACLQRTGGVGPSVGRNVVAWGGLSCSSDPRSESSGLVEPG
jgi:hypothetical protein